MPFQVFARDQYNHCEILTIPNTKGKPESEFPTEGDALVAAKRYTNDKNRNNAFTYDEQRRLMTHVLFVVQNGVYGGNLVMGKHKVIVAGKEEAMPTTTTGRFYLGQDPNDDEWYLDDPRKRPVVDLTNYLVTDKTLVFVKKL
jgi:hypothetical protein